MFTMGPPLWGGGGADPFAGNVLSLMHFDGANGSTTFTDQVPGRVWTRNGTPTISTAQSKFGGSSYSGALSSYLSASSPGSEWLLSGDYSIECWMLCNDNGGGAGILSIGTNTAEGTSLSIEASGTAMSHRVGSNTTRSQGDGAGSLYGRWVHVFAGRSGTTTYTAVSGIMRIDVGDAAHANGSVTNVNVGVQALIGGGSPYLYLDEFRVTKGVCRHTASFTPPAAPYPNP